MAALSGALLILAATFFRVFDPARPGILPGCLFHSLTGFYCPGCGSSRALHQLLLGHIGAAIGFNPILVLSLPFLGAYYLGYAVAAFRSKPWPRIVLRPSWVWTTLSVVVLFGLLRNIPVKPFSWLAP